MNPKTRPKIPIPIYAIDIILEALAVLVLLGFWFYFYNNFPALPETVPIHFNASGEPDGFGSKWWMFWLPSIATVLYVFLTLLQRIPHRFNYPVYVTPKNAPRQYQLVLRFVRVLKILVVALFAGITWHSIQLTKNVEIEMTLPVFLIGIIFTVSFVVYAILAGRE
jgi:uncharacterized membrane protein